MQSPREQCGGIQSVESSTLNPVPRKKTAGFAAVLQEPKSLLKWRDVAASISKLSRDRKLFWELFESSRDALFLVNREGVIAGYNGNAEKLCAGIARR